MIYRVIHVRAALFLVASHSAYTSDDISRVGKKVSSKKILSPQIEVLAAYFNASLHPVVKYSESEFKKYKITRPAAKKVVCTHVLQVIKYNKR